MAKENKKSVALSSNGEDVEQFISEYERGLLSLAIKDISTLTALHQRITIDYFLYPPHKIIYTALTSLLSNPDIKSIDLESLIIESNNLGLKSFGINSEYLIILSQAGNDPENLDFYLSQVRDSYLKYSLYRLTGRYRTNLENPNNLTSSGEELLDQFNQEVAQLIAFEGHEDRGVCYADYIDKFIEERKEDPQEVRGLRTGYPTLDIAINGLMPGTLTIIAGIFKSGKSAVLANIVDYVGIQAGIDARAEGRKDPTVPVLFISTEMSNDEDLARGLAIRSLLEERKITNGTIFGDPKTKAIINGAVKQIKKSQIFHEYMPAFNAKSVCNLIYHYKMKYNIGLAVFDYIKLDSVDNYSKREDQSLGDLANGLKMLAGTLSIPVLSACQVNSRSGLIADTDRIERYANTVIVWRPKTAEELHAHDFHRHGTHIIMIKTTRAGGNGLIPMRFWKKCLKIEEAEQYQTESTAEAETLTTPAEYEQAKVDSFRVETVTEVLQEKDGHDLMQNLEAVDDQF